MVLIESILTHNPCYKAGRKIVPKGIMLGTVRCPQPSAKVFVHNWDRESCDNKCCHAFIDANDGAVYQTLPWNHRGWHSGKHPTTKMSSNGTHIGILMCEPSQIKYKKAYQFEIIGSQEKAIAAAKRTYESAVELCAKLCKDFNFNPQTAILSHSEAHENGAASRHSDPEHLWKGLGLNYTMTQFRNDVAEKMKNPPKVTTLPKAADVFLIKEGLIEKSVAIVEEIPKEQKVRIGVDRLRIRSGPGSENQPTGKYTGKGVFAITEIQNGSGSKSGWGKLKNGEGWISLDYVELL